MSTLQHTENVADDSNQRALEELARAIEWNWGQFSLILAHCNSASLRERMVQRLREICSVELREIVLDKSVKTLYTTIVERLHETALPYQEQPQALMVFGLESVSALEQVLTGANQIREEFRKNFHFPLVLWITDEALQKLIRLAPDLQSWCTTVEFEVATDDLMHFIQQTADQVFAKVLEAGAGVFLDNVALNFAIGVSELESAQQELQSRGVRLNPELEASLEFVLGRVADSSLEQSRQYLERSLVLWEQGSSSQAKIPNSQLLERRGCVLHSLGLWWRTHAERHRAERDRALAFAKDYFQQCVEEFEQAHRKELVAKFINAWGEVLQRLQQWDELETVAQKAVAVHQAYSDPFRLARAYGFLAEVSLAKSAWTEAQQSAQQALSLLRSTYPDASNPVSSQESINLDWESSYHQGWYLSSLARAHQGLGNASEAIKNLEFAREQTKPQYDPELYILILQELRESYFKQGEYLSAFQVKQKRREIEQQYGFRAFIGAGRLQAKQQVVNPRLQLSEQQGTVTQEITASGRQEDVNRLIERIGRIDQKLTVIYGQSGVGKSSIVQAGLIPALKQKPIGTRDILTVLLQVYTDWIQDLGRCFAQALLETRSIVSLPAALDSVAAILEQLQQNADRELLSVLIFDQFEEFFFVYKEPKQRLPFYEFLRDCINIPYVKVILSLREDYLHYLLEFNRLTMLEAINNNILDKLIIYYLGNFSPEDTKSVIQSLIKQTQFFLEPPLIDELVNDLAGELGEVRPIELQVVGVQLQTEKITKLEQYREHGPKEALVGRFLAEVVKDCGPDNEQIVKLVLYLLTDENNTRPLKNRADLEMELGVKSQKLDLILEILVRSGIVLRVPAFPTDRYQLVHDYLVTFVRQQQSARLIAELEKEREQRKLTEAKLNQVLKQQLKTAQKSTATLAALLALIGAVAAIASLVGINTYITTLAYSSQANRQFDLERLVSALKAGKQLKNSIGAIPDTNFLTISELDNAVDGLQERSRLEGHTGSVTSVSFSSDNQMIATASEDKTAKVWSIDGHPKTTLKGHTDVVTSVSFSHDGKMIATGSKDKTVKLWSIDGQEKKTLTGHTDVVTSVSFSHDGKMIATGSKDKTVKLWSLNGREIRSFKQSDRVISVSFSPDGKMLAAAGKDDKVRLWSLDGRDLRTINNYGAIGMRFSPDGKSLILINRDRTVKFYDFDGTLLKKISACCESFGNLIYMSSSPDSKLLASVASTPFGDRTVLFARADNTDDYNIFRSTNSDTVTYLSFSPDGKLLASATKDKTVELWNINSKVLNLAGDNRNRVTRAKFSPDGKIIAVGIPDKKVNLWRRDGTFIKTILGDGSVLSFSPDSQTIATGSADKIVHILSLDSQKIKTFKIPHSSVTNISVSPNSKIIAASMDNTIQLWKSDGHLIKTLPGHTERIKNISFSPDSQMIATIGDDTLVKLWKSDGTFIKTLKGHTDQVTSVIFSPDSKIIASVSQGSNSENSQIRLWRRDGTPFNKPIEEYGIQNIYFSRDGSFVAYTNMDRTVKLWNLDGKLPVTLKRHNDKINDVSFSHDGKTIATASDDGTVKLWSIDGQDLNIHLEHSDGVKKVSFSPDSKMIATASTDKTVKLWSSDGKLLNTIPGLSDEVKSVSFSRDSKIITSVSGSYSRNKSRYNYEVKLWNSKGKEIGTFPGHSDEANSISISPDGRTVAFVSKEDVLKLWSTNGNGNLLATLSGHSDWINSISFSPDGKIASASDDQTIRLWSSDGKESKLLTGHTDKVNSVSFSPDGQTIASASDDKTVRLWNLEGKEIKRPNVLGDKVNSVSFSPDGKTIASASDGYKIQLWSINDTKPKTTINVDYSGFDGLSFSRDGNMLALASSSGMSLYLVNHFWLRDPIYIRSNYLLGNVSFSPDGKAIAVPRNDGTPVWNFLDLDELLVRGCNSARSYLGNTSNNVNESDRHLCKDIGTQERDTSRLEQP